MAFDLNEFRETHRPWMFTAGRRVFAARHVSAVQVVKYYDMIAAARDDRRQQERAVRWLLRLAFPWRPSYLVRGDPVSLVANLEIAARNAALDDFFVALRGGPVPTTRGSGTSGTPSPTTTSTGTA